MELVQGQTLRTLRKPCPLDLLINLGGQIAKALGATHAAGITHRDIKPDNLMLREDGYVKVLDYGLARLRPATAADSQATTLALQTMPGASEESARLLNEVKAASQERMKRELSSFLQEVSRLRPLVLFFDDLHWADVSTIDLLSFLAGKFDALSVLIVVTYRPSDMLLAKHPFLQIKPDLQARGVCRELALEFLNREEIAQYLALEFPSHRFASEFPKLIHTKTEGSPLFMADLVRYLRDRGVIALEESSPEAGAPRWTLAQTLPDIERDLPESVRGMIERKIAPLVTSLIRSWYTARAESDYATRWQNEVRSMQTRLWPCSFAHALVAGE